MNWYEQTAEAIALHLQRTMPGWRFSVLHSQLDRAKLGSVDRKARYSTIYCRHDSPWFQYTLVFYCDHLLIWHRDNNSRRLSYSDPALMECVEWIFVANWPKS